MPTTTVPTATTSPASTGTTAPTTGSQGQAPTAADVAAARSGLLAAANEAVLLDQLGALKAPVDTRLTTFIKDVHLSAPTGRSAQLAALETEQGNGKSAFSVLVTASAPPSQPVVQVLRGLSAADLAAVQSGGTVSLPSTTLLYALDDLANRTGRPPQGTQDPVPAEIAGVVNADLAASGAGATTTTAGTTAPGPVATAPAGAAASRSQSGTDGVLIGVLVLVLLAAGALVAWLMVRRRRRRPAGAVAAVAQPVHPPEAGPASGIDDLMEVSRRLAAATTEADVRRATVREALQLVRAAAGALVLRRPDPSGAGMSMTVGYQSQEGLLVPERLDGGILGRVAETGQPISQVSATEPALRNLPASVAVIPLVGSGQVEAVLVTVRDVVKPFTQGERNTLTALAPVAAAALATARHADSLAQASLVDALTSLGNRRRLDADLPQILAAAGATTGVVMIDLDHFKSVNDTYGHPVGDALLTAVAYVVHRAVRPQDRCYRYGGEEFCVVLPDTAPEEAEAVANRVAAAVRAQDFQVGLAEPLRKTASLGVAVTTGPGDRDAGALVRRADAALYRAKESGRDRVVMAQPDDLQPGAVT